MKSHSVSSVSHKQNPPVIIAPQFVLLIQVSFISPNLSFSQSHLDTYLSFICIRIRGKSYESERTVSDLVNEDEKTWHKNPYQIIHMIKANASYQDKGSNLPKMVFQQILQLCLVKMRLIIANEQIHKNTLI